MSKVSYLIFILLISSIIKAGNPNFEFSGITQFWKIVKIFEANLEPSHSDWEQLFRTPGYKILVSGEFSREFFMENFRLVFKPNSKKELLDKLKSGRDISHLNHYIKIRDNRKLIDDQLKKLKINSYSKKAADRTLEFLPQFSVSQFPPVSFLIFESNGRGSSPIIVDLAATIEWDFESFLAHEYHHWYRNRQLQIRFDKLNADERHLVNALSLIEAEGIADMVDKNDWYTKPSSAISDYARSYLQDVRRTPHVIESLDRIFSRMNSKDNSIAGSKTILRHLPQRGHTTGYYMSMVILEIENKDRLVKCVGNPFEFIFLYNQAAKKSKGKYPQFSKNSIELLQKVYRKCS